MIEENGRSRVYLGVHWVFDAFAVDEDGNPDYTQDTIGGVPLGLTIANDIYDTGMTKSTVRSRGLILLRLCRTCRAAGAAGAAGRRRSVYAFVKAGVR